MATIDITLDAAFQPDRIVDAFFMYKFGKWDHFSSITKPKISIPMGADGIHAIGFQKQIKRSAKNIALRIKQDSYLFYPFREVDKKKDKTLPFNANNTRILGNASIRDALVQAILYQDVLYEPLEALFSTLDNPDPVSFAYRKGKSAPKAALLIQKYIEDGYCHVLDADLSKYFDTIPHDRLLDRLLKVIGNDATCRTFRLVRRFVHTDRVPHRTYKNYRRGAKYIGEKVFHFRKPLAHRKPARLSRLKGVPQGGILSGLLANLYLHDFDTWVIKRLALRFDLKYIRYADDFIVLVKDSEQLDEIRSLIKEQLTAIDLIINETKTIKLDINRDGLDFVGFHFNGKTIRIKEKSIRSFKTRIDKELGDPPENIVTMNDPKATLKWLVWRINFKIQGLSGPENCPKCGYMRIDAPRSLMAFFRIVTDISQIREMDKWTRQFIYNYIYAAHKVRVQRNELKQAQLKSLVNERWNIGKLRLHPCLCDIDSRGIWHFAQDLFQGKKFTTLAKKRGFIVLRVENDSLEMLVGGKRNSITRIQLEEIWQYLLTKKNISRIQLESKGYKSTSQLVALIAILPGVTTKLNPIQLHFDGKQPASFMLP